jgi:NACalpha-BTF3-like transcription factor
MNDILQYLRSINNNLNRSNKSYKNQSKDTNNQYYKRKKYSRLKSPKKILTKDEEIIVLKKATDDICLVYHDYVVLAGEIADIKEIQADALAHIAEMFNALIKRLKKSPSPIQDDSKEDGIIDKRNIIMGTEDAELVKKTSKIYLQKLIKALKEQNYTYKDIVNYFNKNNFPTVSGRGQWHTQTVYRLTQETKEC